MTHILDFEITRMDGSRSTLRNEADLGTEKWIVVNVASACGFTKQYEQLQEASLDAEVCVVGFPCNQFGAQESGNHAEICEFTSSKYGVTFPLMSKIEVKGEHQHPLFAKLTQSTSSDGRDGDIRWNFEKFVIGLDGSVHRHPSKALPVDML